MAIDLFALGKRIKKARINNGISQVQLAVMINVSPGHIGHIEAGSKCPSLEILVNIAAALSVSTDELLTDIEYSHKGDFGVNELLKDCSTKEKVIFKELITFMKPVLKKLDV